jgi:hypothetical protein
MMQRPERGDLDAIVSKLGIDDVLAGQGLAPADARRRSGRLAEAAERALEFGVALLEPRTARTRHDLLHVARDFAGLGRGGVLSGRAIAAGLEGADEVATIVCTIGGRLEREVAARLEDDPMSAMALDGLGNAALFVLADLAVGDIDRSARLRARFAGAAMSPGAGGWPLHPGQSELFELVDGASIGVELTASSQLRPVKSLSMIVGLGARPRRASCRCGPCESAARCSHRARESVDGRELDSRVGRGACDRR